MLGAPSNDRRSGDVRRPSGAEEGEAAWRGRCGGGFASPTSKALEAAAPSSSGGEPEPQDQAPQLELSLHDLLAQPDPTAALARAFGAERPLRIEIGVGNSDFLIQVALRDPGFSYLGFEYSGKRVEKFLKRVRAREVATIRMLRADAVRVLSRLVGAGSVDRFFVNFPDPWPKRRHAKHRLIQPPTAELLARLLAPGGGLSLRTDDPAYAAQMLEVLERVEDLRNLSGPGRFAAAPRDAFPTRYELKYRSEGRAIHYLEYSRRA